MRKTDYGLDKMGENGFCGFGLSNPIQPVCEEVDRCSKIKMRPS